MVEIRVLKYFLMVAREENITKAANLLHLTQPTLSRQLMQLEEELGVSLFRRSKHRIILTEDGMLLRRRDHCRWQWRNAEFPVSYTASYCIPERKSVSDLYDL